MIFSAESFKKAFRRFWLRSVFCFVIIPALGWVLFVSTLRGLIGFFQEFKSKWRFEWDGAVRTAKRLFAGDPLDKTRVIR
jgi:hypothetical protein